MVQSQGFRLLATSALMLLPCVASSASLYGSTVTSAWYCCTSPTEPFRETEFASAIVGSGIEYSETAYYWFGDGYVSWGGTIDVKQTTIELRSTENDSGSAPDTFGGFTLSFVGAPKILSVSYDSTSNLLPLGMSFTDSEIVLNVSNIPRTSTSFAILNIQLAPVPEPTPQLLLLAGLGSLMAISRLVTKHDA